MSSDDGLSLCCCLRRRYYCFRAEGLAERFVVSTGLAYSVAWILIPDLH